jgi:prefoldin subunit 5
MNDVDYQFLLSSYQRKVSELINQNIVYDAKINSLVSVIAELNEKITKLENQKPTRKKLEEASNDF